MRNSTFYIQSKTCEHKNTKNFSLPTFYSNFAIAIVKIFLKKPATTPTKLALSERLPAAAVVLQRRRSALSEENIINKFNSSANHKHIIIMAHSERRENHT
jgi:hypothetical protein